MRFLVDECLSIQVAALLVAEGHEGIHVVDAGLAGLPDQDVMAYAVREQCILLSADTDFGEILARTGDSVPSVVIFRRSDRMAKSLVLVLLTHLNDFSEDLEGGAIVVIKDNRLRIRRLPVPENGND